jgi:hypothetical protein
MFFCYIQRDKSFTDIVEPFINERLPKPIENEESCNSLF